MNAYAPQPAPVFIISFDVEFDEGEVEKLLALLADDLETIERATTPEASDPIHHHTNPPPRLRRRHQGLWVDG